MQSYRIVNYIPGDIYLDNFLNLIDIRKVDEIIKSRDYRTILNKNKRLLKQIDSLIYYSLEDEKNSKICFKKIFNKSGCYVIVYGEVYGTKGNVDYDQAQYLCNKLRNKEITCYI